MAWLETMLNRLRHIKYAQMLSYLKQRKLLDLAKQGVGHTAPDNRWRGCATNQVGFGFIDVGIMAVMPGKATQWSGHRGHCAGVTAMVPAAKGRGRKGGAAYKLV